MSPGLRVFRAHGLGNDYLVAEASALEGLDPAAAARALCDRHLGVGGDGLLLCSRAAGTDFGVRIFNPDGGEAERSGNGLRILALYLLRLERVHAGRAFTVGTAAGPVRMEILAGGGPPLRVAVEMGRARFGAAAAGFTGSGERVSLDGREVSFVPVSVGNPHAVVLQDTLHEGDFRALAPRICTHPDFPAGVNVQFAAAASAGSAAGAAPAGGAMAAAEGGNLEARVWERGAGETLASGSSACAVAAAAVRAGVAAHGEVEVRMPGGSLQVEVRESWELRLTGAVEGVGWVELDGDLRRRLWPGR